MFWKKKPEMPVSPIVANIVRRFGHPSNWQRDVHLEGHTYDCVLVGPGELRIQVFSYHGTSFDLFVGQDHVDLNKADKDELHKLFHLWLQHQQALRRCRDADERSAREGRIWTSLNSLQPE